MKKTEPRRTLRLSAVLVAVGVLAGVGVGVALAAQNPQPIDPTKSVDQRGTPLTFATSTSAPTKSLVVDGASSKVIQGLGDQDAVKGVALSPDGSGNQISVTLKRNDESDLASQWLAQLVVGDVGELTRSGQEVLSDVFTRAVAVGPNSEGVETTTGLGVGAVSLGQEFGSPSDAELSDRVNAVAAKYDLKVSSLKILHPLESALEVEFVVPDDAKVDWTLDQLRAALVGKVPVVEGALIELDSPNGDALIRGASSYRTGNGRLWFAPGQDDRFGAIHGSLDVR